MCAFPHLQVLPPTQYSGSAQAALTACRLICDPMGGFAMRRRCCKEEGLRRSVAVEVKAIQTDKGRAAVLRAVRCLPILKSFTRCREQP